MALIKCPECGKDVSDTIDACIHCGFVLKKAAAEPAESDAPTEQTLEETSQQEQTAEPAEEQTAEVKSVAAKNGGETAPENVEPAPRDGERRHFFSLVKAEQKALFREFITSNEVYKKSKKKHDITINTLTYSMYVLIVAVMASFIAYVLVNNYRKEYALPLLIVMLVFIGLTVIVLLVNRVVPTDRQRLALLALYVKFRDWLNEEKNIEYPPIEPADAKGRELMKRLTDPDAVIADWIAKPQKTAPRSDKKNKSDRSDVDNKR